MSLQRPHGNSSSSSFPKKHETGKRLIETLFLFVFVSWESEIIGLRVSEDSDEELLMVPDMEAAGSTGVQSSSAEDGVNNQELDQTPNGISAVKRRRGRNPVDKEHRSLKR